MRITKRMEQIYEELIKKPDLHSVPQLEGDILIWNLYQNAHVYASCDGYDTCIDIVSDSLYRGSLIHWHPDEDEMVDVLYNLGKKGNILVLKKTLFAKKISMWGRRSNTPFPKKQNYT